MPHVACWQPGIICQYKKEKETENDDNENGFYHQYITCGWRGFCALFALFLILLKQRIVALNELTDIYIV